MRGFKRSMLVALVAAGLTAVPAVADHNHKGDGGKSGASKIKGKGNSPKHRGDVKRSSRPSVRNGHRSHGTNGSRRNGRATSSRRSN
ncbi:MAG: hypothetical protein H0U42_09930 [Thermoleophilaceae bacterium]|nr:hypothetical protein [Thermoleophilaceae bacterium]